LIELFIDTEKNAYKALGFKRFGMLGLFPAVLARKAREYNNRVSG